MYLKKSFNKKRNKTQLSFVQGYRKDGKVKHKVIKNLGYLEDYLDEYDDPVGFSTDCKRMECNPGSTGNHRSKAFGKTAGSMP